MNTTLQMDIIPEQDQSPSIRSDSSSIENINDVPESAFLNSYNSSQDNQNFNSLKGFTQDINQLYANDPNKFIGEWQNERYSVIRKYLPTKTQNIRLYYSVFTPLNKEIIAAIVIVHGFGEHSGRYIHIADYFAPNGLKVYLYDQRGFGYSGGIRGDTSIEDMHQDLETILLNIERSLPIFLYSHALGAAIVYSFCLSNPSLNFQGVISTNAYVKLPKKYSFGKILILRVLEYFLRDIQINSYLNLSHCSKNNFHMRKVVQDKLFWPYLSVRMAYNIYKLTEYIAAYGQEFKVPVLLIHGKEDKVSHHINSIDFYRVIKSKEKTLKIFQQGYHELEHDVECDRLRQMVVSWCYKMCLRDRRIPFIRELNYGIITHDNTKTKKYYWLVISLLIYLALRKKSSKFYLLFGKLVILAQILIFMITN